VSIQDMNGVASMIDSTDLYQSADGVALYDNLQQHGYLLIRMDKLSNISALCHDFLQHLHDIHHDEEKYDLGYAVNKRYDKMESITIQQQTASIMELDADKYNVDNVKQHICLKTEPILSQLRQCLQNVFRVIDQRVISSSRKPSSPIRMFDDQTYIRLKGINQDTPAHVDIYHGRMQTDMYKSLHSNDVMDSDASSSCLPHERSVTCVVCNTNKRNTKLYCDYCRQYWHIQCYQQKSYRRRPTDQVWFCHDCSQNPISLFTCSRDV